MVRQGLNHSRPALSVFDALDKAADDLATAMPGAGATAQATAENLRNIDALLARMSGARAAAGEALNRIDSAAGQGTRVLIELPAG